MSFGTATDVTKSLTAALGSAIDQVGGDRTQVAIGGSGVLGAHGLKDINDLDTWVTPELFKKLSKHPKIQKHKGKSGDPGLRLDTKYGEIEIFTGDWKIGDTDYSGLKDTVNLDGWNFWSPEKVLRWKQAMDRPKDQEDIKKLKTIQGRGGLGPEYVVRPLTRQDIKQYKIDGKLVNKGEATIVTRNGKFVALRTYDKEKQELTGLWVHPKFRRQGIASKLVGGTEATHMQVTPGDQQVKDFYESQGFSDSGERVGKKKYEVHRRGEKTLLFSFGSNGPEQLKERLGRTVEAKPATLPGHKLVFRGESKKWGGGVASVTEDRGSETKGSVTSVTPEDLRKLDSFEGVKDGKYQRVEKTVTVPGADGKPEKATAVAYVATSGKDSSPTAEYREAIDTHLKSVWGGPQHIIVTGHSGAGKSTVARRISEETGLPVLQLDKDQKFGELIKGEVKASKQQIDDVRRSILKRALSTKQPHVIEGTQALIDPGMTEGYRRILVDTPRGEILRRRVRREYLKTHRVPLWTREEGRGVSQELFDSYKPEVDRFRRSEGVEVVRQTGLKDNRVSGYYRKDGKYVKPYTRGGDSMQKGGKSSLAKTAAITGYQSDKPLSPSERAMAAFVVQRYNKQSAQKQVQQGPGRTRMSNIRNSTIGATGTTQRKQVFPGSPISALPPKTASAEVAMGAMQEAARQEQKAKTLSKKLTGLSAKALSAERGSRSGLLSPVEQKNQLAQASKLTENIQATEAKIAKSKVTAANLKGAAKQLIAEVPKVAKSEDYKAGERHTFGGVLGGSIGGSLGARLGRTVGGRAVKKTGEEVSAAALKKLPLFNRAKAMAARSGKVVSLLNAMKMQRRLKLSGRIGGIIAGVLAGRHLADKYNESKEK